MAFMAPTSDRAVSLRFASADAKRQTIPWVEYSNKTAGTSRTYVAQGAAPGDIEKLPKYGIQCVDCHNRPTHTFELPERAVQQAMAAGEIPPTLPFIRKKGVEVLKTEYKSSDEAGARIPEAIQAYYRARTQSCPGISRRTSRRLGTRWFQSITKMFSPISRSPGGPIRIT